MKAIARQVGEGSLFREGDEVTILQRDEHGFDAQSPYGPWLMYCLWEKCSHLRGGYWEELCDT